MCFFLNGVTFIAVIEGLLMMRLPPFHRPTHLPSAGEHAWTRPDRLTEPASGAFLALVRNWEAMMLARSRTPPASE